MSIGYEIKMPPIYTLTFYNGIANQGKMVKPLFVKSVKRNGEVVDTFRTEVLKEALCKPATLRDVQEAMLGVVQGSHATARNVKSPIVTIAGKTGTAQISQGSLGYKAGQTKHNVSFCGYFPVEDPQYSCIVVLTAPSGLPSGGRMAGSVFRKIAERTMLMKSSRTPEALAQDTMVRLPHMPSVQGGNHGAVKMVLDKLALPAGQEQGGWMKAQAASDHVLAADKFVLQKDRVPDVSGMGAKDAFYILGNLGLDVRIIGRGTVVKQSLMPGSTYKKGNVIEIVLE